MGKYRGWLIAILVLLMAATWVIVRTPARLGLDLRGGAQLTLQVQTTDKVPQITPQVLSAVQSVVQKRIDGLGVAEAVVQTAGDDKLLVQLPGVTDPEQAERILKGTAQLLFAPQKPGTEAQLQVERQIQAQLLLEQTQLLLEQSQNANNPEALADIEAKLAKNRESLAASQQAIANLFAPSELTGAMLQEAFASPVAPGSPNWNVIVRFDPQGAELFARLTKEIAGTGRSIGIFLDDRLISAPTVSAQYAETGIIGGNAEISGGFTAQTANDLAIQLQGGALPVPLEVVENRTVGASLGQDSIRDSLYAGVAGLVLVLVFMVAYYRLPGLIADIALVLYAIFTYAAFLLFGVTLTLPGIAGFILSIGMAVDANVLIFERTREELRLGKTLYRSVESGFDRAFASILDSNVTTLIACGALFALGTGFVRGFAVTLAIGIGVSMFTALTCSRSFLFYAISIPSLRKPTWFCPKLETLK
ncbi:protein translocase subunit SecD [Synechococcus sp. PCC 6717]|jgi:preprotein translocase subunit SecD|nr:protein translocase subunit SecD [Synechococcus sp. PCC 6717]